MAVYFHNLDKSEGRTKDFSEYIAGHSGDETIVYKVVDGEAINLSFYYPPDYDLKKKYPLFVFIHGGGWSTHKVFPDQKEWSGDYLGFLARYYAEQGYVSVSIDYRLMRENGQVKGFGLVELYEDCKDAIQFLYEHSSQYSLDFSRSVLLGESAGGYLAGALITLFDGKESVFSKVILVNAITNLFDSRWNTRVPECSNHVLVRGKLKEEIAHLLSPTWQISDKTPKTLLIHGTDDVTVHPEHSQCFYDEMRLCVREAEIHWINDTEHAFLLAEYMLEQQKSLMPASIAVDVIDKWLKTI